MSSCTAPPGVRPAEERASISRKMGLSLLKLISRVTAPQHSACEDGQMAMKRHRHLISKAPSSSNLTKPKWRKRLASSDRTLPWFVVWICLVTGFLLAIGSFQIVLADSPGGQPTKTPTHTPLPSDTPTITLTLPPPPTLTSGPALRNYLPKVSKPQQNPESKAVYPPSTDLDNLSATLAVEGAKPNGPQPIFWVYIFILLAASAVVVWLVVINLLRQRKQNRP